MSGPKDQSGNFEEKLLARLKAVVAERGAAEARSGAPLPAAPGPNRRRPLRVALAGTVVLAIAAAVLIVSSGGGDTSRAFAVEPQAGGGVAVKIYSLEEADKLEAALERAGLPAQVDWLAPQTTCEERHLTPSTVRTSMGGRIGGFEVGGSGPGLTIGVMTKAQYHAVARANDQRALAGEGGPPTVPNISFDPSSFRPGTSVVIVGSPEPLGGDPEGGYRARVEVVKGPVPPCVPVPEAAGTIGAIAVTPGAAKEAATAAAAALPKPGQFLFTKTEVVQLEGWEPGAHPAGPKAHPRRFTANLLGPESDAMPALVPRTKEIWTAPDGRTRVRETLGQIEFLSPADQRRWEAAGSPPPWEFDPAEHPVHQDGARDAYKEFRSRSWRGHKVFSDVPKLFSLPTEAEALRLAIEHRPAGSPPAAVSSHAGRSTVERLNEILGESVTSPALRAAAFGALAEVPGVHREADATDAAGRHGEALTWEDERGFGDRIIFDRQTSAVLADAEMILGPPSSHENRVPPMTPFRETAHLSSAIVDSEHEVPSAP